MLRKIKFRAWDKVSKTMYTDAINNCVDSFDLVLKHPQIYEVMEYTGLSDKNGVEIYEGDILETNLNGVYAEGIARAPIAFINGKFIADTFLFDLDNFEVKVIGNVYENPELLKVGE